MLFFFRRMDSANNAFICNYVSYCINFRSNTAIKIVIRFTEKIKKLELKGVP